MFIEQWHRCYDRTWKGVLPEGADYPAPVSPGLALRVYLTALRREYLRQGDTVLNPFAGTGSLAYHALAYGINYTGLETDQSLIALLQKHLREWGTTFSMLNRPARCRVRAADLGGVFDSGIGTEFDAVIGSLPFTPDRDEWPDYEAIARQSWIALRPGGYAIWITRDFNRKGNKKSVYEYVTESWIKGNEYVGFTLVEHAQALLVEDHGDQMDTEGRGHWLGKVSSAYFNRPNNKRKKVNVQHEDVLFFQKP